MSSGIILQLINALTAFVALAIITVRVLGFQLALLAARYGAAPDHSLPVIRSLATPQLVSTSKDLHCRERALNRTLHSSPSDPPKPVLNSGRTGLTGFLEDKTGVTGAGTLLVGLAAYMISKEIYVINGETVHAVIMGGTIYFMVKKFGKPTSDYIDTRNKVWWCVR